MIPQKKVHIKGWCPSLEKPMETGDGLLVRIPLKFGQVHSKILRKIAELSFKYGNGHLDLSARGNLQFRGVSGETYYNLRKELTGLGFNNDTKFAIIANPIDEYSQEVAEKLYEALCDDYVVLPEKFLIVVDGGKRFSLSALPCDFYITSRLVNITETISQLKDIKSCNKKPDNVDALPPPIGFIPTSEQFGIVCIAAAFGRIEAEELVKLAGIAEKYSNGEIIFAPFRRVILQYISQEASKEVLQELAGAGFITENGDSRLNVHVCVGAPACSSALGNARSLAKEFVAENPTLTQIVHITGCSKGCAYHGKADITVTMTQDGYEVA